MLSIRTGLGARVGWRQGYDELGVSIIEEHQRQSNQGEDQKEVSSVDDAMEVADDAQHAEAPEVASATVHPELGRAVQDKEEAESEQEGENRVGFIRHQVMRRPDGRRIDPLQPGWRLSSIVRDAEMFDTMQEEQAEQGRATESVDKINSRTGTFGGNRMAVLL